MTTPVIVWNPDPEPGPCIFYLWVLALEIRSTGSAGCIPDHESCYRGWSHRPVSQSVSQSIRASPGSFQPVDMQVWSDACGHEVRHQPVLLTFLFIPYVVASKQASEQARTTSKREMKYRAPTLTDTGMHRPMRNSFLPRFHFSLTSNSSKAHFIWR